MAGKFGALKKFGSWLAERAEPLVARVEGAVDSVKKTLKVGEYSQPPSIEATVAAGEKAKPAKAVSENVSSFDRDMNASRRMAAQLGTANPVTPEFVQEGMRILSSPHNGTFAASVTRHAADALKKAPDSAGAKKMLDAGHTALDGNISKRQERLKFAHERDEIRTLHTQNIRDAQAIAETGAGRVMHHDAVKDLAQGIHGLAQVDSVAAAAALQRLAKTNPTLRSEVMANAQDLGIDLKHLESPGSPASGFNANAAKPANLNSVEAQRLHNTIPDGQRVNPASSTSFIDGHDITVPSITTPSPASFIEGGASFQSLRGMSVQEVGLEALSSTERIAMGLPHPSGTFSLETPGNAVDFTEAQSLLDRVMRRGDEMAAPAAKAPEAAARPAKPLALQ